jgi:predicted  nucleic acid-binding Zn-ribbon protein
MADPKKISQLTTAGPLTGVELLPIVQNSGTLQTTVSAVAIFATSTLSSNVAAVSSRLDAVSAAISANAANIATVSALAVTNAAAITSINNTVNTLSGRVDDVSAAVVSTNAVVSALSSAVVQVQASISAINSALAAIDVSALVALESRVSTLEIRVANVSASVSALQVQVNDVSAATSVNAAAITSVNNVVSALEIRVSAASATGVTNAAAITSINDVVSALEIRVSNASAAIVSLGSALTSTNNVVSVLEVRVSAVSAAAVSLGAALTSVNAVVSTKAFRNGDHLTNVQYIDFNTTTSYAPLPGRLTWDIESGTLDLGLTGTVNLLIGQRTVAQVYNNSGVTLPKGKAVRVTGAQGQRLTGALAQADSDADSLTIFGIMLETVSVNNSGYVATDGLVRNVNTAAYADGDIVYLSPVSAGELTPTKPEAPEHLVQMGYIVKGGSVGAGSIYVKVQNGYELGELHDVKTSASTSLADGEVLSYNVSAKVWTNSPALIDAQASISALNIQLAAVSAITSVNAAAVTSINNVVSALEIRVSAASATGVANTAAITSINNVVSALEIRVSAASATGATNSAAITSINNVVSALEIRVSAASATGVANSAAITSVNNVVSALEIRVSSASAAGVTNAAAITSINNVVSALEIRVSTVSAAVSVNTVAINAVSAATSLRVLRAGDRMTGQLAVAVSADQIGVSVVGGLVVTSTVNFTGSSGLLVHSGTTATRPGSPTPGIIRFNSGSNTFEGYTSATWGAIGGGGGATGGGTNQAFYLNDTVVSVSYSIPSGKNAGTFGPVTIATGVTVEVPSGSTWTVV